MPYYFWIRALLAAGVQPGDRVAVCLPGHSLWPALQVACSLARAIAVGVNTRYGTHELEHVLRSAAPRVVITMEDWRGIAFAAMLSGVLRRVSAEPPVCVTTAAQGDCGFLPASEFLARGEGLGGDLARRAVAADPSVSSKVLLEFS